MNIEIDDIQIKYWIYLRDSKKEDTEEEYIKFLKNRIIEIYEEDEKYEKEYDKNMKECDKRIKKCNENIKKYNKKIERLKNDVDRTFGQGFSDMILRRGL